ncbi:hypothetical protein ACSBR1_025754 [Camellia fascicularis]
MGTIVKLLQHIKLRNEHINGLKKTLFWLLFDVILQNKLNYKQCRKYDDIALKIIQTYQPGSSGSFQLGPQTIKLTTEDIKSIFGISCGDEPIHLGYGNKSRSSFLTRRSIQTERLSSTTIINLLQKALKGKKKEDTEDVIRMLCMYTCLKLFFSMSGTTVGWVFLNYMEDINSMRKYNWAEAIRNTLMSSIEKYHKNPAKVTGCVMALLVTTAQFSEESDEELDDTEEEQKKDAENTEGEEEEDAEEEEQEPGSSGSFQLGPKTVKLTTEDIKSIFGISCGDEPIHLGYGNKNRSSFLTTRCIQTERISSTTITNLLQKALKGKKKEDTEDVIRMLCMYTCLKLFFYTSGTTVGWVFLNYMEDINSMRKYNWAEAIQSTLMSSIEKYHKNPAKVTGCVMALLVTSAQLNEKSDKELDDTEEEEKEDAKNTEDEEQKDAEEADAKEEEQEDVKNTEEEEKDSEEHEEEEEDGQYAEECHQEQKPANEDLRNKFIILNDAPEGEEQIHQQTLEKL